MSDEVKQEAAPAAAEEKKTAEACAPAQEAAPKPSRRRRIWKRIGIAAAVVGVLLLAALICRDFLIEQGVRRLGTWLVGTPVEIESFDSSLSGTVEINGLTVGNPEGYHAPHIFSLRRVFVRIQPFSVLTDKIVVEEVSVEGVRVDFESKITETNLGVIQDNVNSKLGALGGNGESSDSSDDSSDDEAKPQPQLVIRKLEVRDYSASVSSRMLRTSLVLPLPPVSMTDVGEGRPIGETVNGLFGAVSASISDAVTKSGGALGEVFKGTGDLIGGAAQSTGGALKDAGKQLKKLISK